MTLWLIVYKSLRQHALSTIVTALSIALAGVVPAFKAYRTDAASNLTPHS